MRGFGTVSPKRPPALKNVSRLKHRGWGTKGGTKELSAEILDGSSRSRRKKSRAFFNLRKFHDDTAVALVHVLQRHAPENQKHAFPYI